MRLPKLVWAWVLLPVCLLSSPRIAAQCVPPATQWLVPPQTSTALTLKWSPVSGATQYQVRYWENLTPDVKTIVDNCGPEPFTLKGLRKNTPYSLQIRTKCGNSTSSWGAIFNGATYNSSGLCINLPAGVIASTNSSTINVSWTSTGSHTIRYRPGNSGDWLIPVGALSVSSAPFVISGLPMGDYQVEIKRNCSATASTYHRVTVNISDACFTPAAPTVMPATTSALVNLPVVPGVNGYNLVYRMGTSGNWITVANNIPASLYSLNPPLVPTTLYQVQIQAVCSSGSSSFSTPTAFTTKAISSCLADKNYGKNLSAAEVLQINQAYNTPSPFTFGSMIGVNDGGLVFRSFQLAPFNQITQLTTQYRNFHTMDEDFDNSLVSYDLNTKPKDTNPEGTPGNTAKNKSFYSVYRQMHGFTQITGATELLQYNPQTWKEKIYKESDWSLSGPAGIKNSFENYTKKFIDEFAPANGAASQSLVSNFQVGNELWDYPIKADYHSLLLGARSAFISKYGEKSAGRWKMKLVAGAFQAFRDNNCSSMLRNFSNCDGDLNRHDFIGDYLEVTDCGLLNDLDAIDCHPYSFLPGTGKWTFPEDPNSETWQIRNMAAWLNANKNAASGILNTTQLWSTEFGFDSNPETGVGEKTQSAYLLRGFLMHSRYHYEKVFFYNAYDVARPTDQYYNGLFNSSGFWKLGTHPDNNSWASPMEAHGATAKPSWYGMLDMKARFGGHIFYKALVEDADSYVILIAKPDGSDPYLVFWSPKSTNDANINQPIPVNKLINWSGVLPGTYKVESSMGRTFAESFVPGQTYSAVAGTDCDGITLRTILRNPAFIRLVSCNNCINVTNVGNIVAPNPNAGGSPFNPGIVDNGLNASGGSGGTVLYQWQKSVDNNNFIDITGATGLTYDPPSLTQTTYLRRNARRSTCNDYVYGASIVITVGNSCPSMITFQRKVHSTSACNPNGDYYYEIVLNQVTVNDQIILSGLPGNGIHFSLSTLNGVPFTLTSFYNNLYYVSNTSLQWLVNASLGATQTLRLYYCWAEPYPGVNLTSATSLCSGQSIPCALGIKKPEKESEERDAPASSISLESFLLSASPNPGTDFMQLSYSGSPMPRAMLRIISVTGQCHSTLTFSDVKSEEKWDIEVLQLPPGLYFLSLETAAGVKWVIWEKV